MSRPRLPGTTNVFSLVLLALLVAGGIGSLAWGLQGDTPARESRVLAPIGAWVTETARASRTEVRSAAVRRVGTPLRVAIPSIGVSAPVVPVRLAGTALNPPDEAWLVGWWRDGARPGDPHGAAVLVAHTVLEGGGVFDDVRALNPADTVEVSTRKGNVAYAVTRVRTLTRAKFARWAPSLSRDDEARLVLISCADWDGARYRSNVVVVARPA